MKPWAQPTLPPIQTLSAPLRPSLALYLSLTVAHSFALVGCIARPHFGADAV